MILIIHKDNTNRYCKDGYFRSFAMFGTFSDCVKQYRHLGQALRVAKKLSGRVVNIPDSMEVEAGGTIIETIPCPNKEGYVNYTHHDLTNFVVKPLDSIIPMC